MLKYIKNSLTLNNILLYILPPVIVIALLAYLLTGGNILITSTLAIIATLSIVNGIVVGAYNLAKHNKG